MSDNQSHTDAGLGRYLSRDAVLFALIIGVLPNIFFLAVLPLYIVFRSFTPVLYLAVGLLSLWVPRWLSLVFFVLVAVLDLMIIISVAFHLGLDMTIQSVKYVTSLDVGASLFYIFIVSVVVLTAVLTAVLMGRFRSRLKPASPLLATFVVMLACGINYVSTQKYFTKFEGPIDGALMQVGLTSDVIAANGRNLLIIMVEGMGAYASESDKVYLKDKLSAAADEGRFRLTSGSSYYQGSTTGAASRELCGKWGEFRDYLGGGEYDCLPRRLKDKGYETSAYHGFSQTMFVRDKWYPSIGFQNLNFQEQLDARPDVNVETRCGSVFKGLCDEDVGEIVKRDLLASGETPQMIYWLTLNSHIPFIPKENGPLSCGEKTAKIDNKLTCQLTEMWQDIFDMGAQMARDPNLPPTDILIVGDHHTPMWDRAAKGDFIHDKVDWYLLSDTRSLNGPMNDQNSP